MLSTPYARLVFLGPRSRRRASQPASGVSRDFWSSPRRVFCARRVRRAPRRARSAGSSRRLRGVISFGDFSLDKQRKVTCRGSATH